MRSGYLLGLLLTAALLCCATTTAQLLQNKNTFTHQDSLRGSITPQRAWWDLKHYNLKVDVGIDQKFITGSNIITYSVLESRQVMQIDLQQPMQITRAVQGNKQLELKRDGNAYFITLSKQQQKGTVHKVTVYFQGHPRPAKNAPWDGGFSWKEDTTGNPFVATSNQGLGASVWWPCKDHMYDEVDAMTITATVPANLVCVANGRLTAVKKQKSNKTSYTWQVKNPINNYGVNLNIGNYTNFSEVYVGEKGPLDLNYYVLENNLQKAKEQFKQVPLMLQAFEHWFGHYPFYKDSFKLVEVPYLGMEHQSSVTYGNGYKNGYLGTDLSGTGWGLKFDFIIIHEAGHEWFANSITNRDIADMWIHEGFTAYSESLYLEYHFGKKAGYDYLKGTRAMIANDRPLIGVYNVNHEGSSDMYYKGANMIHTIRQLLDDDDTWRDMLRGINKTFYHQVVTTRDIENFISTKANLDLSKLFDQYLRDTRIPQFNYQLIDGQLTYFYNQVIEGYNIPLDVLINGTKTRIYPTTTPQQHPTKLNQFATIDDFYVAYKELN